MDPINVESLYRNSDIPSINEHVHSICRDIKDNILDAHKMGFSEIHYELPDNFVVGSLPLAQVQLIIYGRVIEKVEEKGFKVWLYLKEDRSGITHMLHILWASSIDPIEQRRMKTIIQKHLKAPPSKK